MENIKKIYKNLTQVDIDEQKTLWDERGKGYYGEFLVFQELYFNIPSPCKFLMNLEIPTKDGKTTEIDLVMIHETGIYVFEIKHYKGHIYGKVDEEKWTQFFKTTENNVFNNPVLQNEYHIHALQEFFPQTDIYSVIVFTSDKCELRVDSEGESNIILSDLYNLTHQLIMQFSALEPKHSLKDIEKRFLILEKYSKISQETVEDENGEIIEFYNYIHTIKDKNDKIVKNKLDELQEKQEKLEREFNEKDKKLSNQNKRNIIISIISIALAFFTSVSFCSNYKENCNISLNEMKQKFQTVNETGIAYNDVINSCVKVDSKLEGLSNGTVLLQCKISLLSSDYGIRLNENSTYIVIKQDGTSFEYNIFGQHNKYNSFLNILHPNGNYGSGKLKDFYFSSIGNVKDIKYIKITNVTLFDASDYSNTSYANNLEIEIYSNE